MLVLVCEACAAHAPREDGQQQQQQAQQQPGEGAARQQLTCELCVKRRRQRAATSADGRRLRIVCLHGFRQSARNFEVRSACEGR